MERKGVRRPNLAGEDAGFDEKGGGMDADSKSLRKSLTGAKRRSRMENAEGKAAFAPPVKKHPLVMWMDLEQGDVDALQAEHPERDFSVLGLRRNPESPERIAVTSAVVGGEVALNFHPWNCPRLQRRYSHSELNEMARRMCAAQGRPPSEENLRAALTGYEMDLPD